MAQIILAAGAAPSPPASGYSSLYVKADGRFFYKDENGVEYELGFVNLPQVSKSADYTFVIADRGKHFLHPSADTTARTWTIPANASVAYDIGTAITFVNQNGAGVFIIVRPPPTITLLPSTTLCRSYKDENGVATALKITSTEWIISGTGLT